MGTYVMPINRENPIRYAIGIDPDLRKNGFAVFDRVTRTITQLKTLSFYHLVRTMQREFADKNYCEVFIEAGWQNSKANFHQAKLSKRLQNAPEDVQKRYLAGVRERVAKDVGQNHAAGILLDEFLRNMGYKITLCRPEKGNKWSPEFFTQVTSIKTKDQEKIDAARHCFEK